MKKDIRKELKEIQKKISEKYDKHLNPLYKQEKKIKDKIEKQKAKELLGKTFVYKNNHYSCSENKADYWDVYLKVVGLTASGIITLTAEKDKYGNIQIQTENRFNVELIGYEPCSKKEFDENYNKLKKELENLEKKKWE